MNLEDREELRIDVPVRLAGPSTGPVARLTLDGGKVVPEVWRDGSWERGVADLASVISAPPAEPGLLARIGVPVADGGFRFQDLIGLPLRVGGAPAGPVARFVLTPEGIASETWVPGDGWIRDRPALDLLLVAPLAGPELLEELGVSERDAAEVPAELLDVVEEGFSRVVRQLQERHERFRDEQRKIWEKRKAAREENSEDLEELADPGRSPPTETSSDDE